MPIGRLLFSRMPGTQFAVLSLLPLRVKLLNCVLLLVLHFLPTAAGVCPHCHGHFSSCTYDVAGGSCPTISTVASNAAAIAAGHGALSLSDIIPCRYLKMFTRSALDTMLAIAKRPEPGEMFEITVDTTGTAMLNAINLGMISIQSAVMRVAELIETSSEEALQSKLRSRLECLKVVKGDKFALTSSSVADVGMFAFIWGKVSEFVMKRVMQVHLGASVMAGSLDPNGGDGAMSLAIRSTVHRPSTMEEFAEMINLFIMICSGLGVMSVLVLSDFFEHAVYDTIRLRGRTWQLAHELMLIMFRRVEDSGGRLSLAKVCDECHLTTLLEEAEVNRAANFRSGEGTSQDTKKIWNGKFTASATRCCPAYNRNGTHTVDLLFPDGTCRFNHACNHFVSDKGPRGQCLGPHRWGECDNPNKCSTPIAA